MVQPGMCPVNCSKWIGGLYSFHTAGANGVVHHGSVRLLRQNINVCVVYAIMSRSGEEAVGRERLQHHGRERERCERCFTDVVYSLCITGGLFLASCAGEGREPVTRSAGKCFSTGSRPKALSDVPQNRRRRDERGQAFGPSRAGRHFRMAPHRQHGVPEGEYAVTIVWPTRPPSNRPESDDGPDRLEKAIWPTRRLARLDHGGEETTGFGAVPDRLSPRRRIT